MSEPTSRSAPESRVAEAGDRLRETLEWCENWKDGQFAPAYYDKTWPVEMFGLVDGLLRDIPAILARLSATERVQAVAGEFVATMPMRFSHVAGREVPSGFTMTSQPAAVALFDALAALLTADSGGLQTPDVAALQEGQK